LNLNVNSILTVKFSPKELTNGDIMTRNTKEIEAILDLRPTHDHLQRKGPLKYLTSKTDHICVQLWSGKFKAIMIVKKLAVPFYKLCLISK